jgi:hypothetical protein
MEKNTSLALKPEVTTVAKKLDQVVQWASNDVQNMVGFERTYSLAQAMSQLSDILTPEYMKPIMELQGKKLGFKTDSKEPGGYPEKIVKDCLIEATLNGLQVVGNQFNIIKGNMYPTKEGLAYLLNKMPDLAYQIIPSLPRINATASSAAIDMKIIWSINGSVKKEITLPIALKTDQYTTPDAIIGKATRKARAWLYATVTGRELPDGDATDVGEVKDKPVSKPLSEIGEETKFEEVVEKKEEKPEVTPVEPAKEEKPKTHTTSIKGTEGLFEQPKK